VFSESAAFYDAVYGTFKDYRAEASQVATLLRSHLPAAVSVLDVGCGTGEHALHLRRSHGLEVDGLDLDPRLLAIAREKVPEAQFYEADMAAFRLGRRYEVVTCLFSAIGYLRTLDRVEAALACFRAHLEAGGLVVVEPWFTPGVLRPGTGQVQHGLAGSVRVERASHVSVEGTMSRITFDYRLEDADGVRELREVHELGIFTVDEMMAAFRHAGFEPVFDPHGISGRGLYTARGPT
jgi:ubiquinone/menaquinone biosynthesis C-methylase UbiE